MILKTHQGQMDELIKQFPIVCIHMCLCPKIYPIDFSSLSLYMSSILDAQSPKNRSSIYGQCIDSETTKYFYFSEKHNCTYHLFQQYPPLVGTNIGIVISTQRSNQSAQPLMDTIKQKQVREMLLLISFIVQDCSVVLYN